MPMSNSQDAEQFEQIAIIGMSGRFPGAEGIAGFWANLCHGVEAVRTLTDDELLAAGVESALFQNPSYVKAGVLLDGVELFDARFFGFTPREAELTDPQHRIFLECAWEALEDSGYDPDRNGSQIGVFAGAGLNRYLNSLIVSKPEVLKSLNDLQKMIVTDKDYLATRVSYKLNLKGPSITVQTACSTSLVAIHLACQSLLNGECDMALAGGVSIRVPQTAGYPYEEGSILSPDGHCRAFDAEARGMVIGSGAGIVVLKRLSEALSDGDSICAVIKSSCINNDGSDKVGYTSPSVSGQERVIAAAHALAGVSADEITYVETHGTGTSLGDPIEIAALTEAFRKTTQKKGFCAVGSLKTNIGHLDAASGVAGLIKVVLSLQNRMLPPSLNFREPNPAIDFLNSPFYVQQSLSEWVGTNGRRIAGVSSFGIGGTNAHMIVEEAPARTGSGESRPWQLLALSAKTPEGMERVTDNLADFMGKNPSINLADLSFTLQNGRRIFPNRRFLVVGKVEDAVQILRTRDPARMRTGSMDHSDKQVAFMFPGQAAQFSNMGLDIYRDEQTFREIVDSCCHKLEQQIGFDLRGVLFPSEEGAPTANERLSQTSVTQPTIFVFEYALAQLWIKWGLCPEAMIGHSVGEYVAACLAGVLSLDDALTLVAERGRLMQEMPRGSMIAVRLDENEVQQYLDGELSLAAVNGPSSCVVAGPIGSIADLQIRLEKKRITCKLLSTSHAFHSKMMEPMMGPFRKLFENVKLNVPKIPYISNLTGSWVDAEQAVDPGYWTDHLRKAVRFEAGIGELLKDPNRILLEIGPGQTLASLARRHPSKNPDHIVLSSLGRPKEGLSDTAALMATLGQLWLAGAHIDWTALHAGQRRHRVPLPTYPFERQRYWIETANVADSGVSKLREGAAQAENVLSDASLASERKEARDQMSDRLGLHAAFVDPVDDLEKTIAAMWQELIGFRKIGREDDFFELGGDSLLATRCVSRIREEFQVDLSLKDFFEASVIKSLSTAIQRMLIEEMEKLSEEEAQRKLLGLG